MEKQLFDHLNTLNIAYETFEHEAFFTIEQARPVCATLPGGHVKNLFLKDSKKQFWLLLAHADTKVPLRLLAKKLKAPELRFAQPELLQQYLGVTPGSVSPFGLIYDTQRVVTVVIDKKLYDFDHVGFHPLRNTATTMISPKALDIFIDGLGNKRLQFDFETM